MLLVLVVLALQAVTVPTTGIDVFQRYERDEDVLSIGID